MSLRRGRRTGKKRIPLEPLFDEILGHVFSPALLFGKRTIVLAEKLAAP
jgi:hypothetical protein